MDTLSNNCLSSDSQVSKSDETVTIELLIAHLFEAINQREVDYLLDINTKISQYLPDKLYQRIFAYIAKCLTVQEKTWLHTTLKSIQN